MKSFTILLKSKLFEYLKGETTISWNLNNWNSWPKDGSRLEAPLRFNCPKCQQISGPFLPSHNWTIFFMFSLWLVYWLLLSPILPGFGLLQKGQKLCWILQKRIYEYGRFVSCTHNGFCYCSLVRKVQKLDIIFAHLGVIGMAIVVYVTKIEKKGFYI